MCITNAKQCKLYKGYDCNSLLFEVNEVKTYGIIINQVQFFLLFRVSGQSIMYAALVNIVILTI